MSFSIRYNGLQLQDVAISNTKTVYYHKTKYEATKYNFNYCGIDKKLNIQTLKPLSVLTNLKYLRLANLKVEDDTLKPLADLKNLEELWLSNQFETKEYAWLATRLPDTKCDMFNAVNKVSITGTRNELVWDTMITGRKKPFLLSTQDRQKIDKYITEFEKLKHEMV